MIVRGGSGWTAGVWLMALFVSACGGSQHAGSRQESGLHPVSGAPPAASGAPPPAAPQVPEDPLQAFPQGSAPGLPAGAVLRFGDDRLRLEGAPSKVAVAGGRAVTVRRLEAELWDLSSGDRLAALQLSKRPLSLALANDYLFVTEYNRPTRYLRRLSLRKGAPDVRVDLHAKGFEFPLAVSPDGTRAWVGSGTTLIAFDTGGSMQERWRRQLAWSAPGISEGGITELIHSEHGVIVVASGQVGLLDETGRALSRLPATYAAPTRQGLVFGRGPGRLRLLPWGRKSASELSIDFAGPLAPGGDGALWMWDARKSELARIELGAPAVSARFRVPGLYDLLGPTADGVLMRSGARLFPVTAQGFSPRHGDRIAAWDLSPDGRRLATRDRAGKIILWDARTGKSTSMAAPNQAFDNGVSLLREPFVLALDKGNMTPGVAQLLNTKTGASSVVADNLFWHAAHVASDGLHFVLPDQARSGGAHVARWVSYRLDPAAGKVERVGALSYPRLFHECAVVGPKLLAYAFDPAADKTEVFWLDPQGNKSLFQLEGSANLACAPDGGHLVRFGREDSDPDQLLDARGKLVRELGVSKARYPLVSFTTDGKHFGVGVDQLTVEVWSQSASGFEKRATLELAPDPDSPRTAGSFRVASGGTHVYQRRAHDVLVFPAHQ